MRIEEIRSGLAKRLRARRGEIEQAALTRINAVSDTPQRSDPEYLDGLRTAVSAAVGYGIEAVEGSEDRPLPIPTVLLAQARLAARHGVMLETVLRRYLAGYTLLGDFLIEESERGGSLNGTSLKRLLRVQAALLDRLIAAVCEEYALEATMRRNSAEQRRAEQIERLLAGERIEPTELAYDFEACHHIGVTVSGPKAVELVSCLVTALDCRSLVLKREEGTVWAWFGSRHGIDVDEIKRQLPQRLPPNVSVAVGEPAKGLAGWALTHRQAKAALAIARAESKGFVRYTEVALLSSMLQDDLLATSLRRLYLVPLLEKGKEGEVLCEALRAYFAAERNVSSAAAALGVSRRTVANRLRVVEHCIGQPLGAVLTEMDAALRLDEFGPPFRHLEPGAPDRTYRSPSHFGHDPA